MFDSVDDFHIRREREKARKLRQSNWWKGIIHNSAKCYYCQIELTAKEVTMDHIVPVSRGGRSNKGNLVPCCKECNNRKQSLTPVEWDGYLQR